MKKILTFLIFICLSGTSYSQYFTKIMTGPLVNNNTWSEGCAWGDYDNDGYLDVLVTTYNDGCWPCTFPIQLYHNNGNGTFTRITTGPIVNENTWTLGCAWGDYDNDGRADLFVCTGFGDNNLLYHNDGNGNFTKVTSGIIVNDGGFSVSCSWIDYDKDGWLDMFVLNLENDFLYHNNGNGTFTKIVNGALVNDGLSGRSCAVGDYDNDGWIDILVTSWDGPNRLYHNNGGGNFSISGALPTSFSYYGGAAFGDYDNDGWLDLFICKFNSGNNVLYHNNGGIFTQVVYVPSLDSGPESFGCTWADFDNDGWLDLFVANDHNHNYLYKNNSGNGFSRITGEIITSEYVYGVGNSETDINLDGKIDFFVANNGTTNSSSNNLLYQNITQNTSNYIGIKLKGCNLNRSAIGARVTVKAGGHSYIREVSGGQGYHSQDMPYLHFGIGGANIIDSIIVKWTTGNVQRRWNVSPNQYITIDECTIGIISYNNNVPSSYNLSQNYPNPFNPTTRLKFELPSASQVILKVYDARGKEVSTIVDSYLSTGYYEAEFDAGNLSSGIYYYKIIAGNYSNSKKMILIK